MAKRSALRQRQIPPTEVELGRAAGYHAGWGDGYWIGQCESVISRIPPIVGVWPVHVMYVSTGKGFPYSPLDEAVAATLSGMVAQLTVVKTGEPVAEIAAQARPDYVIVLDGLQFDVAQIDAMRALGIRTAIWFTDDPYYADITTTLAPHYDTVFTLDRNCVALYQERGCANVHYLPFCVMPAQFRPMNPQRSKRKEISFIGSGYLNRVQYFNEAASYLATKDTLISGIWWDRLEHFDRLRSKINLGEWMTPQDTALAYNASKIVINMHRAHDDALFNSNSLGITAASPNPRTFEISACAVLQLTDVREDLVSFYTPGVEIVTYESPQDMVEKLDYYLNHENERKEIAIRGMHRTLSEHTYAHRLHAMLSILFS
ncbi:CgeB family protein [Paenibacillus sp. Leaf72]|uniref:CgeB family protein n=1 Tax=Paenibacillus sp. Leaf72 TaxID=1736234 RepID=UPI0006FF6488|nr:glycosyltransferase [Paenibacillus sp. Leaf72]KQO17987.1 spore maturation protein cgeB [Paenibacillus sp. Leaf72]